MARSRSVGVIGAGRMGGPIVRRLKGAGTPPGAGTPLMVWDTSPEIRETFGAMKGVEVAEPGEMAAACAVILFVVSSSAEVAECLKGRRGILQNARPGLVIWDLTTSDPSDTRRLARRSEKKGVPYIDAAMAGGPFAIEEGRLTLMAGGDAKALRRTKRRLAPFTGKIFHLGEIGSGHAMKLIHNMVLHTIFLATCEGARLADRMGMRVEDMIEVFNASTAYSYASRFRFPSNILSGKWNAKARIYNPLKDVGLAVALGKKHGAGVELGEQTLAFLKKAAALGMLEEDYSLLYRDFEKIRRAGTRK
ncbi:MAG: NAD(P)-dependent oxidoreductase [bacterium]